MKTRRPPTEDDIEALRGAQEDMLTALNSAEDILRDIGGIIYERAKSYWIGHISVALSDDTEYLSSSGEINMDRTIDELEDILSKSQEQEDE